MAENVGVIMQPFGEQSGDEFVDEALVPVADIASKVESAFGHFVDNLPPSEA